MSVVPVRPLSHLAVTVHQGMIASGNHGHLESLRYSQRESLYTVYRHRAAKGKNEYFRTAHALAVRLADRAVPNGVAMTDQLMHALAVRPADPPGGNFLCRQKVTKELPRGDAECHAPACQAALP